MFQPTHPAMLRRRAVLAAAAAARESVQAQRHIAAMAIVARATGGCADGSHTLAYEAGDTFCLRCPYTYTAHDFN